ncbi:DUF6838 family protein [Clostridium tyrobutyricum]|uniref:phage tail terminator family protein n=1 Tax=Clostridium tyrobutyricum TaxID=1519 RepID=UPI001C38F6D1|nr:hypothetical protein [Clostridium tyrobutyricum]MBV4423239.1 hypothetical protein [Clostridium tyrobutyricum]MEA5008232.1 hypothetical protein [Clostridium tyrobutyricum]
MISIKDVKDAVALKLSQEFKENIIYDEQVKQGFDPPAFFVQVIPIGTIRSSLLTKNPTLTIDIQFFPETECNDDLYDMQDKLENSFISGIQVKDRFITITKTEHSIVDFVLHFQLDLDYLVSIRDKVKAEEGTFETMKEVHFNKEVFK